MIPFKLLLLDALNHSILIADGPSGEILVELPLPRKFTPTDLIVSPGKEKAFLSLAGDNSTGTLLLLDLKTVSLAPFSLDLPVPARFFPALDGKSFYLADPNGDLYNYDVATTTLSAWNKPPGSGCCAGLAACDRGLCGVWETDGGGVLAIFDPNGNLLARQAIGGTPTGLTLDLQGRVFIPFTTNVFCGEGVLFITETSNNPIVITIQCCRCSSGLRAYPLHVAAESGGKLAYVACEDHAAIGIIDIPGACFCGAIPVGRSISRIALLPDERFAVASSNTFADLCLIDLVNRRPVSFTATKRELLSPFAVID